MNTPNPLVILIDDATPRWDPKLFDRFRGERFILHRFKKNGGLTRSWNLGLDIAREHQADATVCANSDVAFPQGWWTNLQTILEAHPLALLGPITNAPGHCPRQNVTQHLPDYHLTDDPANLALVQKRLGNRYHASYEKGPINGFCMTARTEAWFQFAHNEQHVFNPKFKLTRNEDELQARWLRRGGEVFISRGTFVWHYRGCSRRGATKGKSGTGWFRKKKQKRKK